MVNGKLLIDTESGDEITQEEIKRIEKAMEDAENNYGYHLKSIKHRYFFVDKFYTIDFKKISKNPIQKSKYFNLAEMFNYDKIPETEMIAKKLDGKTWEEF